MREETENRAEPVGEVATLRARLEGVQSQLAQLQRTQEAMLEERDRRFFDFIQDAPIGIYRTTPGGKILLVNRVLLQILGYESVEELARRNLEEEGFEPEYPRSEFKDRIERDGEVRGLEVGWRRCDGSVAICSENARVVRAGDGSILYYEGTVEDITERKGAEEALRAARDRAEAASRSKSEFLANLSHELRTPLHAIVGLADFLGGTDLTPAQQSSLGSIRQAAGSLSHIVGDLLEVAKMEANQISLRLAPLSLQATVDEVLGMFAVLARNRSLALRLDCQDGVPPQILGDILRLRQVLTNLLDNAIKFTQRGGVVVSVRLLSEDGTRVRLRVEVADTGIGIPGEKLEEIFEKFVQVDQGPSRRYVGTGLGLSISRHLVQLMGGELRVASALGEGSTFWFELSFEKCAGQCPDPSDPAPALPLLPQGSLTVLVVDDNDLNQQVAALILQKLGCQVELASCGPQAVEKVRRAFYPLILMDCQLPAMDGFAVTVEIRRLQQGAPKKSRIVAMTASSMDESRERCKAAGMDDFLAKPVTLEGFRRLLERLIQGDPGVLDPWS